MKRKINDFFTPLSKKPNVVTHILQSRDVNQPAVIKNEPTDVKLFIKDENESKSKPVIKNEKENDLSRPISKTDHPSFKKKSLVVKPSSQDKRVLRSLCNNSVSKSYLILEILFVGLTLEDAELVAETLPWDQKRNGAGVAAFAAFINLRQDVHVKRTLDPSLTAPFTDNETLRNFYFTNIFREADNGTKYYRSQMLEQHEKFTAEKLPDILLQTYVYRLVNKKATFQRFGGIPSETEWSKFREFMNTRMREEREERAKPKKKQKEENLEKFFTQAHINQGEMKTVITIEYVIKHKEKMAKQILSSTSLKSAWEVIKEAPHVGDFLSWQITADLCELKLIKLKEDFTALGPGARAGLKKVFDDKISVSEELGLTKALTKLMNPVFEQLGINFKFFLGRDISMKAIEHSLCEFDKYYRAVLEKTSKRKYRDGGNRSAPELSCALCENMDLFCQVEDIWWLCARCAVLEYESIGRVNNVKLRKVSVHMNKVETDAD